MKDPFYLIHRAKWFQDSSEEAAAKRVYINKQTRRDKLNAIQDELDRLKESIMYKEKRRTQAETDKKYKLCEDLTEEIRECERECRKLQNEQKKYKDKDAKSRRYHRKKSRFVSSSESDISVTPASTPKSIRSCTSPTEGGESTDMVEEEEEPLSARQARSPSLPRVKRSRCLRLVSPTPSPTPLNKNTDDDGPAVVGDHGSPAHTPTPQSTLEDCTNTTDSANQIF